MPTVTIPVPAFFMACLVILAIFFELLRRVKNKHSHPVTPYWLEPGYNDALTEMYIMGIDTQLKETYKQLANDGMLDNRKINHVMGCIIDKINGMEAISDLGKFYLQTRVDSQYNCNVIFIRKVFSIPSTVKCP